MVTAIAIAEYYITFQVKSDYDNMLNCIGIGGLGGISYYLRGVYLDFCVKKSWDNIWMPWYFIRPVASLLCGGISYLFLKAGLLVLESAKENNASNLGFYALAFVAGMNVDKFIAKIEDLAQATWGFDKSRAGNINPEPRQRLLSIF